MEEDEEEAIGKYWGERIAFKLQITLAHKQMGINWWEAGKFVKGIL